MNIKSIAFIFLFLPTLAFVQTRDIGGFGELIDDVVAIVNDEVILRSELDPQVKAFIESMDPAIRNNFPDSQIESEILEQLITRRVQMQRADQLGIFITDDEINLALNDVAEQNGLTLTQIPEMLEANGIDYSAYRGELLVQLTMQQLLRRDVAPRILVLPLELESCIKVRFDTLNSAIEFNVSHILLDGSALQIDNDRLASLAEEIILSLESGSLFSDLAREYSSAPTSTEGGHIGWRNGNQLPSIFSNQVTSLGPGGIAEPIIIGNNVHIVKLNDRRGGEATMIPQKLLRHILLNTTELDDDLVIEQRLNEIRDRVLMGEDFGIIASAVSDDPMSASDRGSLGWTSPGYLVPEFESQIASLNEGEITLPFQTRFGWHIAEVMGNRTFDGTNEQIELQCDDEIRNQKFEDQQLRWSTQLREQAYVQILL